MISYQRITLCQESIIHINHTSSSQHIMPPRKAPRTRTTTTNITSVTNAQLQAMIDQGVAAALATRDANRSTNGEDSHNSGTGVRRTERVARECTYQDFMKCQPLFFKGTEGVVKLTQWFERMETVFRISNALSDFLELKNQNHGNQAEGTGARGLVHALGGGEANQDINDMEDDISA
ncbi:hypothetical protein Tco_1429566 [Tanacetum coccineum]